MHGGSISLKFTTMAIGWLFWLGTLFCGTIGALLTWKKLYKSQKQKMLDKIPGPDYNFLFGNSFQFFKGDVKDMFTRNYNILKPYQQYGISRLWFGSSARVPCLNAKATETLLTSTEWLDKSHDYVFLHPWLGTGLLTSTGEKWRSRRKLLTPTFHFKILDDFLNVFNEQGDILTNILEKQAAKGEHFNIYPFVGRCALDIICETAMGTTVNAQENTDSEYMKAIRGMADIMKVRSLIPWLRFKIIYRLSSYYKKEKNCLKVLHEFTNKVIGERQQEFKKHGPKSPEFNTESDEVFGKKRRLALLDMLLEKAEENKLALTDIREEVDTFMFEGHDTTAASLVWILYNIGRYPEVQKKVYEEICNVLGDEPRKITTEDIKNLKYLECVIKETFRLYPPVPFFGRQIHEDTVLCGYKIPGGVTSMVNVYMLHRDEKYFPDPEKFDPERFFPENAVNRPPFAYVPFSAGPRNCIGQRFAMMVDKVLIAKIIHKFKLETSYTPDLTALMAEFVLRPIIGVWLTLEKRKRP